MRRSFAMSDTGSTSSVRPADAASRPWVRRRWRPGDTVRLGGGAYRHVRLLKADLFSENHRLAAPDGSEWVLKIARPAGFLAAHERRVYAAAAGVAGVPELGRAHGPDWFLHRFVPGRSFAEHVAARCAEGRCVLEGLAPRYFDRLEALVRAMHARGLVCLDISKKANVIVTPEGEPALVDLQISLRLPEPRGPLAERLFRLFAQGDLWHVRKHRDRYEAPRGGDEERHGEWLRRERARPLLHRLHGLVVRPAWLALKRRIVPAEPE